MLQMPPQKRDAGSRFGDGFFDDFRGTEEEEALFGSGDGCVEELAGREGAVGFFG